MPTVVAIAVHDLRRRLRDRTAIMLAFIAPFVLATLMGFAFGSDESGQVVRVAVVDLDHTPESAQFLDGLVESLSLGSSVGVVRFSEPAEPRRLYSRRQVAAVVSLVEGFQARLDAGERFLQTESAEDRPLGNELSEVFFAGAMLRAESEGVLARALGSDEAAARYRNAAPAARAVDSDVRAAGSPLGYFGPSMAVVFLFMSMGVAANSLLAERTSGTMARMQAAPVSIGTVIAGKSASIVLLMLLSVLSLWGATALVFGAHWGDPLAVLALAVAIVGAVGSLGLFVTVAARSEGVAQVAAAGVGFVLALLGGNFFPPGSLPPFLERLSMLTPNGWALDGFTTLSLDRGTIGDVVQPLVVLFTITAVVGSAAILRLRRAVRAA